MYSTFQNAVCFMAHQVFIIEQQASSVILYKTLLWNEVASLGNLHPVLV